MVGEGRELNAILGLQIYTVKMTDVYSRHKNIYYGKFVCVCVIVLVCTMAEDIVMKPTTIEPYPFL